MKKTIPIILCMIIIATSIVLGADWIQVVPSPTTSDWDYMAVNNYGEAFGTDNTNKYFFYNGSTWTEYTAPSLAVTGGISIGNIQLVDDNKAGDFYFHYKSSYNTTIVKFDRSTKTFSKFLEVDQVGYLQNWNTFDCQSKDSDACVWLIRDTGINYNYLFNTSGGSLTQIKNWTGDPYYLIDSDSLIMGSGSNYKANVYEWNGVSWISRSGASDTDCTAKKHYYTNSAQRIIGVAGGYYCGYRGLCWYNITYGTFRCGAGERLTIGSDYLQDFAEIEGDIHYFTTSTSNKWVRIARQWYDTTYDDQENLLQYMFVIDYNDNGGMGFMGGNNGILYEYQGTPYVPPPTGTYEVSLRISPNPTVYGQAVNWYATATHPEGEHSNITCAIVNQSNGDHFYNWELIDAPSGVEAYNNLVEDDIGWTNFDFPENYNYTCNATSTITGNVTNTTPIEWNIIGSGTENVTVYNLTAYPVEIPNTNIGAVDKLSSTQAYATAKNTSGDVLIYSFDSNNINNIQYESIEVTAGTDFLTSISVYEDRLYLGTDDELYIYNNSEQGDANQLIYERKKGWILERDYIQDVADINDIYAWVCQDGNTILDDDDAYLYNYTSDDFEHKINQDPCRSIYYEPNQDLLIIHRAGNNDVKIYNATSYSLLSTLNLDGQLSITAWNDLIDVYGNYLFYISASNTIRKIDISNPASPVSIDTCRADRPIVSIEALSNDEVIVGATNQLKVCDFGNNETYNLGGYYVATTLINYFENEFPFEIQKMDNQGKIHVAEDTKYTIYYYEKITEEQPINNPPIINDIDITNTTPCLNQIIEVEIIATDPDEDELTYDWDCDGLKPSMVNHYLYNRFTCTYSTTGNKNIVVFVSDGYSTITDQEVIAVTNCTAPLELKFYVYDTTSAEGISGVLITVEGAGSQYTDSTGDAEFTVTQDITYDVSFSKGSYYPLEGEFTPSTGRYYVGLDPIIAGDTVLTIITKDTEGNPISGSLVSVTNTITGQNNFGFTDEDGQKVFIQMFTGQKLLVRGNNEEEGYETSTTYTSLIEGQQKTVTLTMTQALAEGQFTGTNRGCADLISGVWLCGDLSGNNNKCTNNTDCISDQCGFNGECSRFNYTLCDRDNQGRGQGCVIKNTVFGFFKGTTGTILKYFLYTLVFIALLFIAIMIFKRRH